MPQRIKLVGPDPRHPPTEKEISSVDGMLENLSKLK